MKKLFTLLLLCLLALTTKTNAQTPFSAIYTFSNVTTSTGLTDPTPAPTASGVTFGQFSVHGLTGASNPAIAGRFCFARWGTFSGINPNRYFEVILTSQAGQIVTLDSIKFTIQRNTAGPIRFLARSSADGFAANLPASITAAVNGSVSILGTDTFAVSSPANTMTSSIPGCVIAPISYSFAGGVSRVFRFYAWAAINGIVGEFGLNSVEFKGSTAPIPSSSGTFFWTNENGSYNFNDVLNWRVGSDPTFSANTTGTMTIPTSAPSVTDMVCFDNGAASFSANINFCDLTSNNAVTQLSVAAILAGNYGGYLYAMDLSLLYADTMSLDGFTGLIFDAPNSGTIEITKALHTDNFSDFNNNATLHLSGSGAQSISGSGFAVSVLKISGGGTKTLNAPITVLDNVDVSTATLNANGNLILPASSNLTARVAPITGGGSITGNAEVHAFVPGGGTGWDLLGTSGVNNQSIGTWNSGGTSPGGQQFPITCSNCVWTPGQAGGFTSIQEWDESTNDWLTNATTATPLTPGKGYWVYMSSGQYTTDPFDIQYNGTLAQGNVNVPVTKGTGLGWNLLANPYPSPITASLLTGDASNNTVIQANISVWDATQNNWVNPSVIAAGQGFYVEKTNAGAGTVTFKESMKSTANSTQLVSRQAADDNLKGFDLTIQGFYGDGDKTRFDINSNANFGYDRYDFHKQFVTPNYMGYGPSATYSKYTSISSIIYKDTLAINALSPGFDKNVSIPIVARGSGSGSYTISVQNLANFPNCLMLKDKVTGMFHDVKATPYIFTMSDTTSAARFELMVCRDEKPVVSVAELNADSHISIAHNGEAVLVNTYFEQTTKALISVYNIMGQKLINDQEVTGTHTSTRLNLDARNQVLIIKVTTDKESLTKKVVVR